MITLHTKMLLGLLVAFFALPQLGFAYVTTEQTATQLTERTMLYTVTYRFGTEKYDMHLPIGAMEQTDDEATRGRVEYAFLDDDDSQVAFGTSGGLVLSSAKIVDGQYVVPRGQSATFKLFSLLTLPEDLSVLEQDDVDLSLAVMSLPFTLVTETGEVLENQLNSSELLYYRTPDVDVK